MAFNNRSRNSDNRNSGKNRPKADYKKVGSVWQDKENEERVYISADDYSGNLLFQDKKTQKVYKVKFVGMFDPKPYEGKKPPKNLLYNLLINLKNKSAVEPYDGEDDTEEDSE